MGDGGCGMWRRFANKRRHRATTRGYTLGMKTAVSLPDDLFAEAERIARRLKKPRSRLYSEAIREYLARHDPDLIAEKLNEVMRGLEPDDGFVATAGRKILERTDW